MIIGLTVNNNDYHDILLAFSRQLTVGHLCMEPPPEDGSDPNWYENFQKATSTFSAATKVKEPTDAQRRAVIDAIQHSWRVFIKNKPNAEYLSERLKVTIPTKISSEWRNGEQFYIFPTSYQDTVLVF